METYKFNQNSLVRCIGFNPYKLESIFTHGILSTNKANELGIPYTRNYKGYNSDDHISMIRPLYSSIDDPRSCYYTMVPKNVSLIIEDQDFLYDYQEAYFNHADEVLVENEIPTSKFVGIMVPEQFLDYELKDLPMIPIKSTSYEIIKSTCDQLIHYLSTKNHDTNIDEYKELLNELKMTIAELNNDKDDEDLINEFMAENVQTTFDSLLECEHTTLEQMLNYMNDKTLQLPIYGVGKSLTK